MVSQIQITPAIGNSPPKAVNAQVEKTLEMSLEADEFLNNLSEKTGLSEGNVLRLALGMFKIAVDAKQQGKHVGVAERADALEIELIGF